MLPASSSGVSMLTRNSGSLYSSRRNRAALPMCRLRSPVRYCTWYAPSGMDSFTSREPQALPKEFNETEPPSTLAPCGSVIS